MHGFVYLAGHGIDGGQVALVAVGGLVGAAVPALVLAVLGSIDRDLGAGCHRRDIRPLGLLTVRGRPVVVAASDRRTHLLRRLARVLVGQRRIGLDVLVGIVVERLAGLLVNALGPVDVVHVGLGADHCAVGPLHGVEGAVACGMR